MSASLLLRALRKHKKRQIKLQQFSEECRILGDGKCLRDTTIQIRNKLYSSLAGIKRIRIHDFRHSHASLLAHMGINIQEVARRLGHTKIEITWNTYAHLYPKVEEKAISVLNTVENPYTLFTRLMLTILFLRWLKKKH